MDVAAISNSCGKHCNMKKVILSEISKQTVLDFAILIILSHPKMQHDLHVVDNLLKMSLFEFIVIDVTGILFIIF